MILQALLLAAARAFLGIGEEEKTQVGVGENLRTDVAAFHHEPAKTVAARGVGLTALVIEQGGAEFGDRGEMGDGSIDLGRADFGVRDDAAVDLHRGGAAGDAGGKRKRGECSFNRGEIAGGDATAKEFGGERAVEGAGVDVEQVEPLAEDARRGGFAGGGAAVDGDDDERGGSHFLFNHGWTRMNTDTDPVEPRMDTNRHE